MIKRHQLLFGFNFFLILLTAFSLQNSGGAFPDPPTDVIDNGKEKVVETAISVDGPYVFHNDKGVTLKSVSAVVDRQPVIVSDEWTKEELNARRFMCKIDDAAVDSFEVQLRPILKNQAVIYEQPSKLLAISDIEGNFYAFKSLLKANGVIDEQFHWSYGAGHLVLLGDFVDRGNNVTACLWLIYQLEAEAEKHGGKVHFIIGNHEEMIMRGDERYVRDKYKHLAKSWGMSYQDFYGENTELGRWLRTHNVVEKIGGVIFVHGGISDDLASTGLFLEEINWQTREYFGMTNPERNLRGPIARLLFKEQGPMWFRGYFETEEEPLDLNENVLPVYEAERVVVGHTKVDEITYLLNKQVIAIDVEHPEREGIAPSQALLMEEGDFFVVDNLGNKKELQ